MPSGSDADYLLRLGPGFNAAGSLGGGPSIEIAVRCVAGPDEKINVLDVCGLSFDGSLASGHVVECSAAPALP